MQARKTKVSAVIILTKSITIPDSLIFFLSALTIIIGCIESYRIALTSSRPAKSLSWTTSTIWDSSCRRLMLTERTRYPTSKTKTSRKNSRLTSSLKHSKSLAATPLILRTYILIGATASIQAPTRTRTPCLMIRTTMIVMWIRLLLPLWLQKWLRRWQAQSQIVRCPPGRALPLPFHAQFHSRHFHPPYQWVAVVP